MKIFILIIFLVFSVPVNASEFHDEKTIPIFANYAIKQLVIKWVLKWNDDGYFKPFDNINRAEFSKIIVIATWIPIINPDFESFPDVKNDIWYFKYIESAKNAWWIDGHPNWEFKPWDTINRAEISKILANAFWFESPTNWTDQNWYDKYVRIQFDNWLTPFWVNNDIHPEVLPSRAEISEQIFRFMEKKGKITAFKDTVSWAILTSLLAEKLSIDKKNISPNASLSVWLNFVRWVYKIKYDQTFYSFLSFKKWDKWIIAYAGRNPIPCSEVEPHWFPSSMILDCSYPNPDIVLDNDIPKWTFKFSNWNFYWEMYAYWNIKIINTPEPFCVKNCTNYSGVYLIVTKLWNSEFKSFLEKNRWEKEREIKLGLWCLEKDSSIRYYNHSDKYWLKEFNINLDISKKILNSWEDNKSIFKLTKLPLSWWMWAPACYSHYTTIEVFDNVDKQEKR